ncbi:MAG TPA: hypothetical protein VF266_14120 [Thermoanaerobaculia bacterium]
MTESEPDTWVIIEVKESGGSVDLLFAPRTLQIPAGWIGNIVWYVFTPGWQLSMLDGEPGVRFVTEGFNGVPQADPTRPNCWSAAVANDAPGSFHYMVTVHREGDPSTKLYATDPVVKNDPPPPTT